MDSNFPAELRLLVTLTGGGDAIVHLTLSNVLSDHD